jgi:PAS domain S-box-containing protein
MEKTTAELIIENIELAFLKEEAEKCAAELVIANKELLFQNEEKEKRAAELVIANKELVFQNEEKERRAAELVIANKELAFQNAGKEKRAAELVIANKELDFQTEEKEKRAAELVIANKELDFQNEEKEKRAVELIIINKQLSKSEDLTKKLNQELLIQFKNISDYKYAFDESSIVAITDQKGIIQFVNDNFCKISKYTRDELIGQDHRLINSGYHSKEFFCNMWVTIGKGDVFHAEIKNRAKDGTFYWVDTTIVPFPHESGRPKKFMAIRQNITERVLAYEKIKSNEKKYLDLLENSLVAIFITNASTRKTNFVNKVALEFFGYKTKEDFLENYDPLNHFINPTDLDKMRNDILEIGIVDWEIVKMKKIDGTPFSAKLFSKLSADKSFIQTDLLDITEQTLSREELENKIKSRTLNLTNSLNREKELNEMKTRFVSFASHEFRTPLSSILSSSSLIEMYNKPEHEEQRLKLINRIAASVKNLTDILDDFLINGELEKGITQIETNIFNLPEFILTVVGELDGMVNQKNQQIIRHHSGETIIEQSAKILRNILLNLLSNASKYSPQDKEIIINSSVANNKVSISIRDHGIGIPDKDQKKLFSQFYRGGNVEHIQGTGLGLAIVKKYVELINGKIEFISKTSEGTTFTIEFSQNNAP